MCACVRVEVLGEVYQRPLHELHEVSHGPLHGPHPQHSTSVREGEPCRRWPQSTAPGHGMAPPRTRCLPGGSRARGIGGPSLKATGGHSWQSVAELRWCLVPLLLVL